jgi:hypothetical protein
MRLFQILAILRGFYPVTQIHNEKAFFVIRNRPPLVFLDHVTLRSLLSCHFFLYQWLQSFTGCTTYQCGVIYVGLPLLILDELREAPYAS